MRASLCSCSRTTHADDHQTYTGQLLYEWHGAVLVYFGFLMAQQEYVLGQKTTGMQWPEWLYGMWIPICGAVLIIRYLQLTAKELKAMKEEN